MKEKLISLVASMALVATVGFKVVSYADSMTIGSVEANVLNVRCGHGTKYPIFLAV